MRLRRLPLWVWAVGVIGLLLELVALVVKIAMGDGSGHRYIGVDAVRLVGALLIVVFAMLAAGQEKRRH